MRQVSIATLRSTFSLAFIQEGPVEITHHGHVIATIQPNHLVKGPEPTHVTADAAAPQPIRTVQRGTVTPPPGVQRGVTGIRSYSKADQARGHR